MPKINLQAGEQKTIQTPAKYLSILSSTLSFTVEANEFGALIGEAGRQFELDGVTQVVFANDKAGQPIEIEFEVSPIKVYSSGKGAVTVVNDVVVQRINESIQVEAQATVEDGKMTIRDGSVALALDDVAVPANGAVKVMDANAGLLGRKVTLVNISQGYAKLRVGFDNTVSASKGLPLFGGVDSPASMQLNYTGAVFVYNDSDAPATIALSEVRR